MYAIHKNTKMIIRGVHLILLPRDKYLSSVDPTTTTNDQPEQT